MPTPVSHKLLIHSMCTLLFPGHFTKICRRPIWDVVQYSSPREHSSPRYQIHVWLPGWAGRQTWHSWHRCTSHVEKQLVRAFFLTTKSNFTCNRTSCRGVRRLNPCWAQQVRCLHSSLTYSLFLHLPASRCVSGWTWSRTRSSCLTSIRAASRTPACRW